MLVLQNRGARQTRRHVSHRRLPCHAGIVAGEKKAATGCSVNRGRIYTARILAIGQYRISKTSAVPPIARREVIPTVVRDPNAIIIRPNENLFGVLWMDRDGIDLQQPRGGDHPRVLRAATGGAPETLRRAGKNEPGNGRMLHDGARAPRLRGYAFDFAPGLAGVASVVDATASGSNDGSGIPRINIDSEDIGVIDDPGFDRPPTLPSIHGFVGQVPGACVNNVRVARIDSQRLYVLKTRRG